MATILEQITSIRSIAVNSTHPPLDRPWLALPSGTRLRAFNSADSPWQQLFPIFMCVTSNSFIGTVTSEKFFVGNTPLFSTMDTGYFLGIAQSLSRGGTTSMIFLHAVVLLVERNTKKIRLTSFPPNRLYCPD